EREQHVAQSAALRGKHVGVAHRMLLIRGADNDAGTLQALETIRQNVGWNALRRTRELAVSALAVQQVPHHQQRPLIAHDVERIGDCAGRAEERLRGTHTLIIHGLRASSDLQSASEYASVPSNLQIASCYKESTHDHHSPSTPGRVSALGA